jgi:predicted HAD superfamily Cof-like phosphohydrolase
MITEIFKFNEEVIGVNVDRVRMLNDTEWQWLKAALKEEMTEMETAHTTGDIAGMVDGALDMVYFAIGALRRMGLTTDQAWDSFFAIHNANMTKKKGKLEKRGDFEHDAVKPENFVPPEQKIKQILGV